MKTIQQNYKLPKNAIYLMHYFAAHGAKTQKSLNRELNLTLRALRYALDRLEGRSLIEIKPYQFTSPTL